MKNFVPQVQEVSFRGTKIKVVRDDLSDKFISGNKFRKLYFLLQKENLPQKIITSGGVQSNFLLAISYFCKMKNIKIIFVTREIPKFLRENPIGNFKSALDFGTDFKQLKTVDFRNVCKRKEIITELATKEQAFLIEFGGAENFTLLGMQNLVAKVNFEPFEKIILPSGTGSSSFFLQKALLEAQKTNKILTVPCVGNSDYLQKEFEIFGENNFPEIIENDLKRPFGSVPKEILDFYFEFLEQTKIELDLLYGSYTLYHILKNTKLKSFYYVHTGGILGNRSLI